MYLHTEHVARGETVIVFVLCSRYIEGRVFPPQIRWQFSAVTTVINSRNTFGLWASLTSLLTFGNDRQPEQIKSECLPLNVERELRVQKHKCFQDDKKCEKHIRPTCRTQIIGNPGKPQF